MMKSLLAFYVVFLVAATSHAQHLFTCQVKDAATGEPMESVTVTDKLTGNSTYTKKDGKASLQKLPAGTREIVFSFVGFKEQTLSITLPQAADAVVAVDMERDENKLETVIISSTRTDTRIENNPTRVEVLGTEEVEEESGIKPSHVASLLGDIAGIQTQQTSAITGNTDLRIQGLPGDYTQLLRDGMPLFGGYAGSFSILQIPPLDLKQIEIVKGASSTLYGGGAIAGMINIISKKPVVNVKERYLLFNQSTLRESNINMYLSERDRKAGYTFFGGGTYQHEMDVNEDGFSDIAATENFTIHPTFFYYPNEKNTFSIGINSMFEDRRGGDMRVLNRRASATHQFYIENQSYRNTLIFTWDKKLNKTDKLTVKATTSSFNRSITSNVFGMRAKQLSWYAEVSLLKKRGNHDMVSGINYSGENFTKKQPDSSSISNYNYVTAGVFIQDDWRISSRLTIESGFRADFQNEFGVFLLPRVSLLYRISPSMVARFGGGLGYKVPTVFSNAVDERDYKILRLDEKAEAERSAGLNFDINYKKKTGNVELAINQSFFYTRIAHPLVEATQPAEVFFYSAAKPVTTRGLETWIQLAVWKVEAYLGYTYTDARKEYDPAQPRLSLSARNKFASVISYEILDNFRVAAEMAYTGSQWLDDGRQTPGYFFLAGMLRYDVGRCSFVLNGENLLDYRQTKVENILILPVTNPRFRQLWAPIDGRVINLSLKVRL